MAKQRIGWPDRLILQTFTIVVSREQCNTWYKRIEAGEKPLVLGLLPPVPESYLREISALIKLSTVPPVDGQSVWMFLEPRWVN